MLFLELAKVQNMMEYDRDDSFTFNFEQNGISFGSKSIGKLSSRSYSIQFERKWKSNFLSGKLSGGKLSED